jgi:hypothetical protein
MDNSEQKSKPEGLLDDLSLLDAIARCGELQMNEDEIARLLAHRADAGSLLTDLRTPGTAAFEALRRGEAEGALKLNIALEANVENPKVRDACKSLSAERRRQAVNRKLDELF